MESCLIFANSMILCWLLVWFCTGTSGFSKPENQRTEAENNVESW